MSFFVSRFRHNIPTGFVFFNVVTL